MPLRLFELFKALFRHLDNHTVHHNQNLHLVKSIDWANHDIMMVAYRISCRIVKLPLGPELDPVDFHILFLCLKRTFTLVLSYT